MSVSKSQLYRDCEDGGRLSTALVGTKVDLDHKDARIYCAEHNYQEPDVLAIKREASQSARVSTPANAVIPPDEMRDDPNCAQDYLDMPLKEIIYRYGTQPQFKDLMQATKTIVQTRGLEDEQQRKRGDLVHRVIAERLIAHIDGLQKTLLSDAVANMANTAMVMTRAGDDKSAVEHAMRNVLSRIIKSSKAQAERMIRDA